MDFGGDAPAGEEDAAIAGMVTAPRAGVGEEGEGEVGGLIERAGFRGEAVGRPDGEEFSVSASDEPEDWRGVEGPESAQESAPGDDAAEGGAAVLRGISNDLVDCLLDWFFDCFFFTVSLERAKALSLFSCPEIL